MAGVSRKTVPWDQTLFGTRPCHVVSYYIVWSNHPCQDGHSTQVSSATMRSSRLSHWRPWIQEKYVYIYIYIHTYICIVVESRFFCRVALQRLTEKESYFHRHRYHHPKREDNVCSKLFLSREQKDFGRCCPYGLRVIFSAKADRNLTTTPKGKTTSEGTSEVFFSRG